jgi:hypothetical protein
VFLSGMLNTQVCPRDHSPLLSGITLKTPGNENIEGGFKGVNGERFHIRMMAIHVVMDMHCITDFLNTMCINCSICQWCLPIEIKL